MPPETARDYQQQAQEGARQAELPPLSWGTLPACNCSRAAPRKPRLNRPEAPEFWEGRLNLFRLRLSASPSYIPSDIEVGVGTLEKVPVPQTIFRKIILYGVLKKHPHPHTNHLRVRTQKGTWSWVKDLDGRGAPRAPRGGFPAALPRVLGALQGLYRQGVTPISPLQRGRRPPTLHPLPCTASIGDAEKKPPPGRGGPAYPAPPTLKVLLRPLPCPPRGVPGLVRMLAGFSFHPPRPRSSPASRRTSTQYYISFPPTSDTTIAVVPGLTYPRFAGSSPRLVTRPSRRRATPSDMMYNFVAPVTHVSLPPYSA